MKRLLVLPLIAASVMSFAACRSVTPAISVNGETISIEDFEQDLRDVEAAAARDVEGDPTSQSFVEVVVDGHVTEDFVTSWVAQRANGLAIEQELAARDLEITEADRAAAREGIGEVLDAFSGRFADELVDGSARASVLSETLAAEGVTDLAVLFADADITIDPRYGRWDPELLTVLPNPPIEVRDGRGPQPIDAGPNPFG